MPVGISPVLSSGEALAFYALAFYALAFYALAFYALAFFVYVLMCLFHKHCRKYCHGCSRIQ